MEADQDYLQSGPEKTEHSLLKRVFIILSLLLVPGALPFIVYSRAREKGLTRPLVLLITISLLIIGIVITTLTWAF
ncbi:MAG TPA: hypothetical protein PLR71_12815 [Deltaproteobacteria bacterium]|nr:hypothetical protein [Deltaproteobacteria bacterium]HQI82423.1 hypothetical protein [Deltaproteobacteria bacterium]